MILNIGDVVELKSGGPKMTVQRMENEIAYCTWFVENKKEGASFALDTLKVETRG